MNHIFTFFRDLSNPIFLIHQHFLMKNIFHYQYALIKKVRYVVFDFLESAVGDNIHKAPPALEHLTLKNLLEHNARCYFHWLAYFALKHPEGTYSDGSFENITAIRQQYKRVDAVVAESIETFGDDMASNVDGIHDLSGKLSTPALKVFAHVTTHDFHHKGQMMLICRMLGHVPPETDVSGD